MPFAIHWRKHRESMSRVEDFGDAYVTRKNEWKNHRGWRNRWHGFDHLAVRSVVSGFVPKVAEYCALSYAANLPAYLSDFNAREARLAATLAERVRSQQESSDRPFYPPPFAPATKVESSPVLACAPASVHVLRAHLRAAELDFRRWDTVQLLRVDDARLQRLVDIDNIVAFTSASAPGGGRAAAAARPPSCLRVMYYSSSIARAAEIMRDGVMAPHQRGTTAGGRRSPFVWPSSSVYTARWGNAGTGSSVVFAVVVAAVPPHAAAAVGHYLRTGNVPDAARADAEAVDPVVTPAAPAADGTETGDPQCAAQGGGPADDYAGGIGRSRRAARAAVGRERRRVVREAAVARRRAARKDSKAEERLAAARAAAAAAEAEETAPVWVASSIDGVAPRPRSRWPCTKGSRDAAGNPIFYPWTAAQSAAWQQAGVIFGGALGSYHRDIVSRAPGPGSVGVSNGVLMVPFAYVVRRRTAARELVSCGADNLPAARALYDSAAGVTATQARWDHVTKNRLTQAELCESLLPLSKFHTYSQDPIRIFETAARRRRRLSERVAKLGGVDSVPSTADEVAVPAAQLFSPQQSVPRGTPVLGGAAMIVGGHGDTYAEVAARAARAGTAGGSSVSIVPSPTASDPPSDFSLCGM